MIESERFQRYLLQNPNDLYGDADEAFRQRILAFLGLEQTDFCDAFYYDYSELPHHLATLYHGDMYMIFGINSNCEMVSKWIDRYELDMKTEEPPK